MFNWISERGVTWRNSLLCGTPHFLNAAARQARRPGGTPSNRYEIFSGLPGQVWRRAALSQVRALACDASLRRCLGVACPRDQLMDGECNKATRIVWVNVLVTMFNWKIPISGGGTRHTSFKHEYIGNPTPRHYKLGIVKVLSISPKKGIFYIK